MLPQSIQINYNNKSMEEKRTQQNTALLVLDVQEAIVKMLRQYTRC